MYGRKEINIIGILGITLFWAGVIGLIFVKLFFFQQVTVVGMSMEPNYYTSENLLVNQIDKKINRGQVVAVYQDKSVAKNADYFTRFSATFYLKRAIGMPGEEIELVGSKVILYNSSFPQGAILNEDYISDGVKSVQEQTQFYFPRTKIPDGEYFLMGDNRTNSRDSRNLGTFPLYAIFGQESIRFWPVARLDVFKLPTYKFQPLDDNIRSQIIKEEQSVNLITTQNQ